MTDILDRISGNDALQVVRQLCASDSVLRGRILCEVKKVLGGGDPDEVASDVFLELDGIDVEELWGWSGPSRYGYSPPEEMADAMIEEALRPHTDKVKDYQAMHMPEQSKQYCMGVLRGIYRFEHESKSQLRDWSTDIPRERSISVLDDWRRGCSRKADLGEMAKLIREDCPNWAQWALAKPDRTRGNE